MTISKTVLERFLNKIPVGKVIEKAVNASRGQRLWPSQTSRNDQANNFRADRGSELSNGKYEVIIQANKNAEDKGVRESADKDSHKIISKVVIDPKNDPEGESFKDDALADFKKRL
jgi:hypothetical protein